MGIGGNRNRGDGENGNCKREGKGNEGKEKKKKSEGRDRRTYIRNKCLLTALQRPQTDVPIMAHCCEICVSSPHQGPSPIGDITTILSYSKLPFHHRQAADF